MAKTKIFACGTLEEEIRSILPQTIDCEFLEAGLHNTPSMLKQELQKRIKEAVDYDTLLIGYGLCSNGTVGLNSDIHTIVIPKVHDCISLLIGSRKQYNKEFHCFPGSYYLSKGWLKVEGDPLSEYHRYLEKYGEENARWLIDEEYKHYQRVVFIHTVGDSKEDVNYSQEVAKLLNIEFSQINGTLDYFEKLINGNWDEDFLIFPPRKLISMNDFM
ncbi:Protein of unknown function (DUF1638) [Desulfosporosinus orientis DSM 765]|uniref:DUF1638 domain-containing protein n=1 Tax=Desulfosporosinus orientis (strain ATCC 19365 / DSM 765 / NCIMB 8382 / VKM B-1628 / Singapore I) TaxID=768706 RepID=G7W6Y5_DESOD|nr:DUF1638 domain-containing protein [Desulfosporosinus orientis]AET69842.1 Protein of unknown function (DUF1638) [Desulfosporosinus orientis DSM 765]